MIDVSRCRPLPSAARRPRRTDKTSATALHMRSAERCAHWQGRPRKLKAGPRVVLLTVLAMAGACSSTHDKGMSAKARDEVSKVGDEALGLVQKEAMSLGQTQMTSVTDAVKPYVDALSAA